MTFESRIGKVREELSSANVDVLLVTNLTNVRYLTGFSGSNGQVLIGPDDAVFMSDPRYAARAQDLVQGADISIYADALTDILPDMLTKASARRVGIEAETMTVAQRDRIADKIGAVELIPTRALVEDLRRVKDAGEIAAIRRAVEIGDAAFEWIIERLSPGRTEREVALDLEIRMRNDGADDVSFEPIVGSGPLSAHIHHTPGDRAIERGDLVLLDFGSLNEGYCSDLTRTVVVGRATDEQKGIYSTVLDAQQRGISAMSPGAEGAGVDAAARDFITEAGYGEAFGHGLGHGVGLDIHEAPRLAKTSKDSLESHDVVTVEPGIYRVGWGGIRIEDCVLVTEDGGEVLGRAPKEELLEL